MFEFITGFILGMGYWLIAPAILMVMFFDHKECYGWSVICTIVLCVAVYLKFEPTAELIGYAVLTYIPIGLLWSAWRWRRRCAIVVKEAQDAGEHQIAYLRKKIVVKDHIDTIVSWVLIWPFSVISTLLGDFIDLIEATVRGISSTTYARWSASANNVLDERIMDIKAERENRFNDR